MRNHTGAPVADVVPLRDRLPNASAKRGWQRQRWAKETIGMTADLLRAAYDEFVEEDDGVEIPVSTIAEAARHLHSAMRVLEIPDPDRDVDFPF